MLNLYCKKKKKKKNSGYMFYFEKKSFLSPLIIITLNNFQFNQLPRLFPTPVCSVLQGIFIKYKTNINKYLLKTKESLQYLDHIFRTPNSHTSQDLLVNILKPISSLIWNLSCCFYYNHWNCCWFCSSFPAVGRFYFYCYCFCYETQNNSSII